MTRPQEFAGMTDARAPSEEPLVHSWRPAAPTDTGQTPIEDGVHLADHGPQPQTVSTEADAPSQMPRRQSPRRATPIGMLSALIFAAAVLVLLIAAPGSSLSLYVAIPVVLTTGTLIYYLLRASHPKPAEFESQPAHGSGKL